MVANEVIKPIARAAPIGRRGAGRLVGARRERPRSRRSSDERSPRCRAPCGGARRARLAAVARRRRIV
jgi:hypothetical protein